MFNGALIYNICCNKNKTCHAKIQECSGMLWKQTVLISNKLSKVVVYIYLCIF